MTNFEREFSEYFQTATFQNDAAKERELLQLPEVKPEDSAPQVVTIDRETLYAYSQAYASLNKQTFHVTNGQKEKDFTARSKGEAENKLARNPAYRGWKIVPDSEPSYYESMAEIHDMRA